MSVLHYFVRILRNIQAVRLFRIQILDRTNVIYCRFIYRYLNASIDLACDSFEQWATTSRAVLENDAGHAFHVPFRIFSGQRIKHFKRFAFVRVETSENSSALVRYHSIHTLANVDDLLLFVLSIHLLRHLGPTVAPVAPPAEGHNALMESIRKGKTLRKVDPAAVSTSGSGSGDARNDLMDEIRRGKELKPAADRELGGQRDSCNRGTDALADALRRALQERNKAFQSSDEDESTSDNDEWDD